MHITKSFIKFAVMKNKKHTRANQRTVAALRREVARLGGIITAKKNVDAARESLVSIMDETNNTVVTPYILMQNGWTMHDNALSTVGYKGAFQMIFYKKDGTFNKRVMFSGNHLANLIEVCKPQITVGEVNQIMQIFGNSVRLQVSKPY